MIFLKDNSILYNSEEKISEEEIQSINELAELNCLNSRYEFMNKMKNSKIINKLYGKQLDVVLEENKNIVLFPPTSVNKKKDSPYIITGTWNKKRTTNVAGFFSYEGEELRIGSRFSKSNKTKDDYFLSYMLKKVLGNEFNYSKFSFSNENNIFDMLMYIFPYFVEKASHQGVYKEYVTKRYNDMNIRGNIDINRHIKNNTPFIGNIAYRTKEYSFDNDVTQLIRHTIEVIKQKNSAILNSNRYLKECVSRIIKETPTYKKSDRHTVIINNKNKVIKSAYYSNYIALQKLCIQILTNKYGDYSSSQENTKMYGVVIDIAWLWEEYIACITEAKVNKDTNIYRDWNRYVYQVNPMSIFKRNNFYERYPDFTYMNIPIDTKYKINIDPRNDFNQVTTYMYMLRSCSGGFIKPLDKGKSRYYIREGYNFVGDLVGYGGEMFIYNFEIPEVDNYEEFEKQIKLSEENLVSRIEEKFRK